jgi:8-oxo-dGTP pyrophosphatase MutT (NUDIX family)
MIDDRWYSKPLDIKISLAAGGIVVRWIGGNLHVALVKEDDFDEYILPKGRVEEDESLEMAAKREIEEEAGLTELRYVAKLDVLERLNYRRTSWKVTHYFLFLTDQEGSQPSDPTHQYRCEWFPIDRLPGLFWPEQEKLIVKNRPEITRLVTTSA